MQPTDKIPFTALLQKVWRFHRLEVTGQDVADWIGILAAVPFPAVETAFNRHLADPKHGSYLPKPADIFRQLAAMQSADDRPGADEAWGLLLRVIRDERETAVLSDEMRIGWIACQPILDLGDEVGARLAFRETYHREVERARKMAVAPRWMPTLGTDPTLRQTRLREAVEARRIGVDTVRALLPGATPAAICQVAGLLEGPAASEAETAIAASLRQAAQILHHCNPEVAEKAARRAEALAALPPDQRPGALAAMLRAGLAESERRRAEQRQQQRDDEAAKKATIRGLLEQNPRDNDTGQAAA